MKPKHYQRITQSMNYYQINNQSERMQLLLTEIETTRTNHPYWRLAIIGKTSAECQSLYEALDEANQEKIQLITSEEDYMKRSIIIIPAFLAKGLEFDSVFAWNIGENFSTPQDRLILYTIATRAMHELTVFIPAQASPFLTDLPQTIRR